MKLAIIGDYNPLIKSHQATNEALAHAAQHLGITVDFEWIPTKAIKSGLSYIKKTYNSFLISPGGVYNDVDAALEIIKHARTANKPTLGTCGGFQFMVIEYARNVMGIWNAAHGEVDPGAENLLIKPLNCNLKGSPLEIKITDTGSRVYAIYQTAAITESYFCNYGLAPEFQAAIHHSGFRIAGTDDTGEARILALQGHDFFVASLFVPQINSALERPNKLITAFLGAAAARN